jgi:DNA-binding SARP family transcriptional activator
VPRPAPGGALYGGELLSGSYRDWLLAERERLAQAYVGALMQLAALHEERRQYAVAHALLRLLQGAWRKDV